MSTSDMKKTCKWYLIAAIFVAVFSAIYEHFSFGVYSAFMIGAFAIPLVGGLLFFFINRRKSRRNPTAAMFFHWSVATLTVGSLLQGVLDIYGTTNRLMTVYWVVGTALLLISIFLYFLQMGKKIRHP